MHETITIGHTSVASGERLHQIEMPRFGLGVWQLAEGGQCKGAILHAINSGYRLIDTARAYYDEEIRRNPWYPDSHYNLGLLWARLDRLDAAVQEWERAIEVDQIGRAHV